MSDTAGHDHPSLPGLTAREAELIARERGLAEREQRLEARETALAALASELVAERERLRTLHVRLLEEIRRVERSRRPTPLWLTTSQSDDTDWWSKVLGRTPTA